MIVVVPLRLLWELGRAVGRLLERYVLRPLGWTLDRLLWRPLRWLLIHVVWRPLTWVTVYLLWTPLVWFARRVVVPPLCWLARVLRPAARWLGARLLAGGRRLRHIVLAIAEWLTPAARALSRVIVAAFGFAWRLAGTLARWLYLILLRPIGLAIAFVWRVVVVPTARVVGWAWRHSAVPIGQWLRRAVLAPSAAVTRRVLAALDWRRRRSP